MKFIRRDESIWIEVIEENSYNTYECEYYSQKL